MKKLMAALVAHAFFASAAAEAQLVTAMDDIQSWAGSGTNRSALVVQWNDGNNPVSVAWGYRWDGAATGTDLLTAVAGTTVIRQPYGGDIIDTLTGADPALQITIERYGWGDIVYSMVYSPGGAARTQADWSSGYWEYSLFAGNIDYYTWNGTGYEGPFTYDVAGNTLYSSVAWWSSQVGSADRLLVNGSWDAWSFAAGLTSVPVAQPVAASVPEPSVTGLLVFSALVATALRRKSRES